MLFMTLSGLLLQLNITFCRQYMGPKWCTTYIWGTVTILSVKKIRPLVILSLLNFVCILVFKWFCINSCCRMLEIKMFLTKDEITHYPFTNCWCHFNQTLHVCFQNKVLMYSVVFCLTDLVENFDEASKNEANWWSLCSPPSTVLCFTSYGLTKGISSCGETVVKGAVHHLRRYEPLRV